MPIYNNAEFPQIKNISRKNNKNLFNKYNKVLIKTKETIILKIYPIIYKILPKYFEFPYAGNDS